MLDEVKALRACVDGSEQVELMAIGQTTDKSGLVINCAYVIILDQLLPRRKPVDKSREAGWPATPISYNMTGIIKTHSSKPDNTIIIMHAKETIRIIRARVTAVIGTRHALNSHHYWGLLISSESARETSNNSSEEVVLPSKVRNGRRARLGS